jgi:hypothetical protein
VSSAAVRATTASASTPVNPGLIVEGSWGTGAAGFDRTARTAWALSLTGAETRSRADGIASMGELFLEQARELSTRWVTDQRKLRTAGVSTGSRRRPRHSQLTRVVGGVRSWPECQWNWAYGRGSGKNCAGIDSRGRHGAGATAAAHIVIDADTAMHCP